MIYGVRTFASRELVDEIPRAALGRILRDHHVPGGLVQAVWIFPAPNRTYEVRALIWHPLPTRILRHKAARVREGIEL